MSTQKIVSRWDSSKVLFECDVSGTMTSGTAMRYALDRAVESGADLRDADLSGADLSGAYLSGANLRDANLRGADLRDADLRGANLSDADLRDANLSGAYLRDADLRYANLRGAYRATDEQAIENLDKVRAIILDDKARLEMGHWHALGSDWKDKTCAEEAVCGTTHCLAGWLQVCATDPKVRAMDSPLAGIIQAPVAAKMFFRDADQVLTWLTERKYVADIADGNARAEARAARKAQEASA
jgi:hypothetical protein